MSKGKIPIGEGRKLAEKYKAPIVIVFTILDGGDSFNVMSYGQTKALCRHAADIANKIAEKVLDGTIAPSEMEPSHLPESPTQWQQVCCGMTPLGKGPPCCGRAGEYNGYGSDGPTIFTCPKNCGCHD